MNILAKTETTYFNPVFNLELCASFGFLSFVFQSSKYFFLFFTQADENFGIHMALSSPHVGQNF